MKVIVYSLFVSIRFYSGVGDGLDFFEPYV